MTIENMGTASGLIELYHIPGHLNKYKNGNENGGEGFGHVGFTVPDVEVALERAKEFGYTVIKPLGDDKASRMGVPEFVKDEDVAEGYKFVFRQLAFIVDPDVSELRMFIRYLALTVLIYQQDYWVELVPQRVKQPSN